MHTKIKYITLQFLAVFIPASLILYYALNAGQLPDNDYWGFISHIILESGGFSTHIGDWVQRDNEHYVLLPKLVYALNIVITEGNNRGLSLFAWYMGLLQVFLLYQVIPVKSRQHPALFCALLFAIGLLIFCPRQAHNWFLGMSGVAWISANFFVLSAIISLNRYARTTNKTDLLTSLGLSLCAVATYSTSLALFPTLIIAAFLLKLSRRDQILIAVFSLLILGLYLSTYSSASKPSSMENSFGGVLLYFLAFIGSLFAIDLAVAIIDGGFGLISSGLMITRIYKNQTLWRAILPWVFIQLYICGNAAMATLARSGDALEQALSSRYGSLPALFWLAWIMIASVFCTQQQKHFRKIAFSILSFFSFVIILFTFVIGHGSALLLLDRAEKQSLAMVALYSRAYYLDLLSETALYSVSYEFLESEVDKLVSIQHIPFSGMFRQCPEIGSQITNIHPPVPLQHSGFIDYLKLRNHSVIEVNGWAHNINKAPNCIVITNDDKIVKGIVLYGLLRPDLPKTNPYILNNHSGWQGYANVDFSDKTIKVFMQSLYNESWVPLFAYYQINPEPPYFTRIDANPEYPTPTSNSSHFDSEV